MKDEIVVYWCPWWDSWRNVNHNIWYHDPVSVHRHLVETTFNPPTITTNFMQCPAVIDKLKRTYVFFNQVEADLFIDISEDEKVNGIKYNNEKNTNIPCDLKHSPTLDNQFLIEYGMSFGFFAEESLNVSMTSPFFHRNNYTNYGSIVPGEFDVAQWFRPFNIEINLWDGVKELKIQKGEPLVYFEFGTDKKIIFKRFEISKKLDELAISLIHYKPQPRWRNLLSRYSDFKRASMHKIIMQEIKKNLIN